MLNCMSVLLADIGKIHLFRRRRRLADKFWRWRRLRALPAVSILWSPVVYHAVSCGFQADPFPRTTDIVSYM